VTPIEGVAGVENLDLSELIERVSAPLTAS
jgi:hypothetical protein